MLAIQSETKISLITDLRLFQVGNRYAIEYNKEDFYNYYDSKEEAMADFTKMANSLKRKDLEILTNKLYELAEVSENDRL